MLFNERRAEVEKANNSRFLGALGFLGFLGFIGDKTILPYIKQYADDENLTVRSAVILALMRLKGKARTR